MGSAPSDPSRGRSVLIWSKREPAVQRSSETIGTIAAALAKAQAQLLNPEKSLTGTIEAMEAGRQSDRFAMRRSRAGSTLCARP
jgi:hypothetical protein